MSENILIVDHISKQYRLGQIGNGTLAADLQSWWARVRHKEDPNTKVGTVAQQGNFKALDDVSFEVKGGERLGIIGHNGAGKSTMLKLISRVTAPTEGRIWMNGRVASMLEVGTGFHGELTGRENVYLNGAILGMTKAEVARKFDEIVDFAEIEKFIDTPVKRYSSGMYVKLAFSVAAHLDAEIMIMDEVLAVGDMRFQQKCLKKMNTVSKEDGRTVLYVSHNMNTIRQLCSRCLVLNKGTVQYDGNVEQAIGLYMNQDDSMDQLIYDLEDAPRPTNKHGLRAKILRFEFLRTEDCVFDVTKSVYFRIDWMAHEDIDHMRVRLEIHSVDGTPVAMAESDVMCDAKDGVRYSHEGVFDLGCLAEGNYYFCIDMYNINELGMHLSYDHPERNIHFAIENNRPDKILWHSDLWGHIRLQNIKIKESCP